jgi:hypothetical protein
LHQLRFKRFVCDQDVFGRYTCAPLEKELAELSGKQRNRIDVQIAGILSNAYELHVKSKETLKTLKTIMHLAVEREDKLLLSIVMREVRRLESVL